MNKFRPELKVWLGLTFYPIEDTDVLNGFRQSLCGKLCPFMEAIRKTTKSGYIDERESIYDEIIYAARSNYINNQLSREWYNFVRNPLNETLDSEHDNLIATNLE